MRFIALLLLSIFTVVACSSDGTDPVQPGNRITPQETEETTSTPPTQDIEKPGEIKEVVLTSSEQEQANFTLVELTESQILGLGVTGNPGYGSSETFHRYFEDSPQPNFAYFVFYEREDSASDAVIITATFNSEDVDAALTALYFSLSVPDTAMILNKENTVVVVISEFNPPSAEDIADKLSKRLGIEPIGLGRISEACVFSRLNCTDYSVTDGRIELVIENNAGREMVVKEVIAISEVIQDSECRTGELDQPLPAGLEDRFVLNKTSDDSVCNFTEGWMGKNRYNIKVEYVWKDSMSLLHRTSGILIASGPP